MMKYVIDFEKPSLLSTIVESSILTICYMLGTEISAS